MGNWKAVLLFLAGLLAQTGMVAAEGASNGRLRIVGSGTMAPLVTEIAKRFQALHPGLRVDVEAGGSRRGLADARDGKADIGMVARALGEEQQDLYGVPIARDGIALVVHRDNPVRALSDRQVVDIYTGRIDNWKQLGGRDAPIYVVKAEAGGSSTELFTRHFAIPYEHIKAQQVLGGNPARVSFVGDNPGAILYMSVGEAERRAQAGFPLKLLPVGGIAASSRSIRSGDYPIARALTLVTRGRPSGPAKAFIEYALSPAVTDLILANDFAPYLD